MPLVGQPTAVTARRLLPLALAVAALGILAAGIPAPAVAASRPPRVDARTAVVVDAGSGAVLWGKDPHRPVLIASTTKILTALVAVDTYQPAQVLTVPEAAEEVDGTRLGFTSGMRLGLPQLLTALLVVSANDAAETLAAAYPRGGRDGFVQAMNAEARALGCTDSSFRDPSGLDAPGHRASAADLAILGRALLGRPVLAAIVRQPKAALRWPDGHVQILDNHNFFVGRYHEPGALGIKTGYTIAARQTIVVAQRRGSRVLIAVVLGAPTRSALYEDVRALLAYGFAVHPGPAAELLGRPPGGPSAGEPRLGAGGQAFAGPIPSRLRRHLAGAPVLTAVGVLLVCGLAVLVGRGPARARRRIARARRRSARRAPVGRPPAGTRRRPPTAR